MKELEKVFIGKGEVKGFIFTQIKRSNLAYIYEVSLSESAKWYEVFARKEYAKFDMVSYPKSNSFGEWAWTCGTIEKAEEIFHNIETNAYTNSLKNIAKKLQN